jgi:hypothetical protein
MEKASKNGVEVLSSFSFTYKEMASRLNKKKCKPTYAITHKLKIKENKEKDKEVCSFDLSKTFCRN